MENDKKDVKDPDLCDCFDCFDSDSPCHRDCDLGEECAGCLASREEMREVKHTIDCALGRH